MDKKYLLGIIGAGNMSTAIQKGILKSGFIADPAKIIVSDVDTVKLNESALSGIKVTTDNDEVYKNAEFVLFAVKPQIFHLIKENVSKISASQHIISIMAGISVETLLSAAGKDMPVCRVMPNTPCMIGQGMSVLCYHNYNAEAKAFADGIFASVGDIAHMDESAFDAVTSISGSGPAYVYMFLDAMIKGGIEGGLSEVDSRKLAVQTAIGAAGMVKTNPDKPVSELVDAVCSKGGTTIEAVKVFKDSGLTEIVVNGIAACRKRSKELSGK